MRKMTGMILFLLFIIGCSHSEPHGQGYILSISENSILVVEEMSEQDIGIGWNEFSKNYNGQALKLRTDPGELEVGQYVSYWIDGDIAASYPGQAQAEKIEPADPDPNKKDK